MCITWSEQFLIRKEANLLLVLGAPWGQIYCLREGLAGGLSSCLWPKGKPYSDGLSPTHKKHAGKSVPMVKWIQSLPMISDRLKKILITNSNVTFHRIVMVWWWDRWLSLSVFICTCLQCVFVCIHSFQL